MFDYDTATDRMTITHLQDVEPALKLAAEMRASSEYTKHGIKNDMLHYAIIPEVIQLEMLQKHGVDCGNRDHWPAVYKLLNTEYKRFKTTEINHSVRNG